MSLLMDALKRAESAKQESARNAQGGLLPTTADLILEPITSDPAKGSANPLPDLALHLAAVDADLAQSATVPESRPAAAPPRPAPPQARPTEAQETVRSAFAAKQPSPEPSRRPLWIALGTLGLAGLSIGAYVWYQMNNIGQGSLSANVRPPVAQPVAPAIVPAQPPAVLPPPERASASIASTAPLFPRPESRRVSPPQAAADAPENLPIRLTRTRPEADRNLAQGYTSLQQGDTELARHEFEQSLRRDPNNTDALLALAAIAQRQGRLAEAEGWRQRAMVANPSDPATQAAVLNSPSANADPLTTESRLKSLLSSQPESASLNFALGNLYSRQSRWAEAQQVYFNAVAGDGDNPDYLFNLAVSLDHLRQARLAAQHYRLALEAATKRPAGFDRDSVNKRLGELQGERQP
ncbi:tetratricopeptide repeat protein [Dechloromonas sp. HYN0024]|uniref:tetratricopeptide repeat protein n=1 Tax=Dechloromonas sp. HYN0024 TaxID=2231055 RepID=UPI000E433A5F|nr:tetratricopeptide repeat protein [Dechloromonas sp. HYN0024]AXS80758.1 hypothetical protein HYN24_12445 [Dechloromonas sp. HYN0024]